MFRGLMMLSLLFVTGGCGTSEPDTLIKSTDYDEQEMEAAIALARKEADQFIAELASPAGTDHAVKAPIEDNDLVEHFWLVDVSFENGTFTGTIDNDPGIVSNVTIGQTWTVKKEDISDWLFFRDNKMYGNYTVRPLLNAMPPDQAKKIRSILATP